MLSLVTGGTGFVGSHLVERLVESGRDVRCIVRPGRCVPSWLVHPRISIAQCDLRSPRGLADALDGVDEIYHVAGAVKGRALDEFVQANAESTRLLLRAARGLENLRRFVLVSSQAAVGPSRVDPELGVLCVREDDGLAPISAYGQSKLAAEVIARRYRDQVPITIVRPPTVYGPRDVANLPFFQLARLGIRLDLGKQRRISLVHVADLVEGIMLAGQTTVPSGRAYFLPGPEDASLRDLMQAIGRAVGRPGISLPVPERAVVLAGQLMSVASQLVGSPAIFSREKALEITAAGWVCDGTRARQELGYQPRTRLADGIASTAEWYLRHRWLR